MPGIQDTQRQLSTVSSVASDRLRVVNLTEQLAVAEVDLLLATCDQYSYRRIFALPTERQRLIRYALNRVNNVFLLVQSPRPVQRQYESALAQKPAIREALREGMQTIANVYLKPLSRPHPLKMLSPLTSELLVS